MDVYILSIDSNLLPLCPGTLIPAAPTVLLSQALEIPDTAVFRLAAAPPHHSPPAQPCSVPCWDLLQPGTQGSAALPLPRRHVLLSALPRPGAAPAAWSLPAPVAPDFPRQSVSVPREPDPGGGPSSRWVRGALRPPAGCHGPFSGAVSDRRLAAALHIPHQPASGDTAAGHSLLNVADLARKKERKRVRGG